MSSDGCLKTNYPWATWTPTESDVSASVSTDEEPEPQYPDGAVPLYNLAAMPGTSRCPSCALEFKKQDNPRKVLAMWYAHGMDRSGHGNLCAVLKAAGYQVQPLELSEARSWEWNDALWRDYLLEVSAAYNGPSTRKAMKAIWKYRRQQLKTSTTFNSVGQQEQRTIKLKQEFYDAWDEAVQWAGAAGEE
jgi:hypothetical protein